MPSVPVIRRIWRSGVLQTDDYFVVPQNARLVKNGDEYYRTMFKGCAFVLESSNRHMGETLRALDEYLGRLGVVRLKRRRRRGW